MDLEEKWQKVMAETEIFRFYRDILSSHTTSTIPYIFLGPSLVNAGDTIVRKGQVVIDKPMIILPQNMPQFSGFELDELDLDPNLLQFFFLVRGVRFPSLKYQHEISTIDVFEGGPDKAIDHYRDELERKEDLSTGLIYGCTDLWQLSVLFYVMAVISKSTPKDLDSFIEELRRRFLS